VEISGLSQPQIWNEEVARRIIAEHSQCEGPLLPILHALSDAFGCVPAPAVPMIAETLNISRAEVHGVITFYHDFRSAPAKGTVVKVCRAEACQAMGGPQAAEALLHKLGIDWGGASKSGAVTVEAVYCLGLCAAAPAALIGDKPIARLDGAKLIAAVEAVR
jgi:formate dehydrogenase subunit gamma